VLGYASLTDCQTIEYVTSDKLSCFEMCLTKDNCTMVSFNKKHQNDCLLRLSSKNANSSRAQQFPVIKFDYFYYFRIILYRIFDTIRSFQTHLNAHLKIRAF